MDGITRDDSPYERWRSEYGNCAPLTAEEREQFGLSKRDGRKFKLGAKTRERAEECGRCAEQLDNGRYCIRLPMSVHVRDGGSEKCQAHANNS